MEQNILSMITKNKFKEPERGTENDQRLEVAGDNPEFGCFGCEKSCDLCKHFLIKSKPFTTPNTTQTFKIKSHIDCNSENVIYLIFDKKCPQVFYIGYTQDSMKVRWRNHKSHIKKCKKSCEIASHFTANINSVHKLDKSSQALYTSQLKEHLSVLIIECLEPVEGVDMRDTMHQRENFWQAELKSATMYGGINKRTNS